MFEVGSRVTFRSRDKEFSGQVLELRGEHARCSFADGRTAWVPLTALAVEGAPAPPFGGAPSHPFGGAPSHPFGGIPVAPNPSLAPSGYPGQWMSQDKPLEAWLIAVIYLGLTVLPLGCSLVGAIAYSVPYFVWRKEKPNRARQWNMHVWIAFASGFALWVGGAMVFGMVTGFERAREDAAATTSGELPKSWKTWNAGACSIQAPASWAKNSPASNPWSELELIDGREEAMVLLNEENVADFEAGMTVEQYAALTLSDAQKGATQESVTAAKVGPYNAQREVRSGLVDGAKLTFVRYVFRSRTHFHQVTVVAKTRTFPSQEPLLNRIMESARCGTDRDGATAL